MRNIEKEIRFSPSLCVTHKCNLKCIYCYQNHDKDNRMSFDTACKSIDWIFSNIPENMKGVEVSFIGGEPQRLDGMMHLMIVFPMLRIVTICRLHLL